MEEKTPAQAFAQLAQHIRQLSERYQASVRMVAELSAENQELKNQLETKEKQLQDFQYQLKISKIVEHLAVVGKDSASLKNQIDEYIKEIDDCIAFLEKEV